MSVRLAAHWLATAVAAAFTATVATIPFTGPAASAASITAAAGVSLIGLATTPTNSRKDVRP
jgi:hypothetical protein